LLIASPGPAFYASSLSPGPEWYTLNRHRDNPSNNNFVHYNCHLLAPSVSTDSHCTGAGMKVHILNTIFSITKDLFGYHLQALLSALFTFTRAGMNTLQVGLGITSFSNNNSVH